MDKVSIVAEGMCEYFECTICIIITSIVCIP